MFSTPQDQCRQAPQGMDSGRRLQVLQTSLAEVDRDLRQLRRRQEGECRQRRALWETACLVHWLAPGEPEAAMAFLEMQHPLGPAETALWARHLQATETCTVQEERHRLTSSPASLK